MENKYYNKLPKGCGAKLQEWVGERVNLEKVILYSYVDESPEFGLAIVVVFIGKAVVFYRLLKMKGWSISVDQSITLDELEEMTMARSGQRGQDSGSTKRQ